MRTNKAGHDEQKTIYTYIDILIKIDISKYKHKFGIGKWRGIGLP